MTRKSLNWMNEGPSLTKDPRFDRISCRLKNEDPYGIQKYALEGEKMRNKDHQAVLRDISKSSHLKQKFYKKQNTNNIRYKRITNEQIGLNESFLSNEEILKVQQFLELENQHLKLKKDKKECVKKQKDKMIDVIDSPYLEQTYGTETYDNIFKSNLNKTNLNFIVSHIKKAKFNGRRSNKQRRKSIRKRV